MRSFLATPVAVLLLTVPLAAQSAPAAPALKWGPAPAIFPAGAQMAVVSGDPGKAGMFSIELSMPAGYKIPPHFHPTAEHVVVLKGTFLVGMGDKLDPAQMKPMAVGDSGTIPALAHHYAMAKLATVVEVTAMGPFAMTYVNPKDTPQGSPPKPAPTGY
jgi:quercetin dioxygenase-like cupin family protein